MGDLSDAPGPSDRTDHWDSRYRDVGAEAVSWFEADPVASLAAVDAAGVRPTDAVIDVGGGASRLVDALVARGFSDLTVLDVSQVALDASSARLGERAAAVTWICKDLLSWEPGRRWDLWHDRAVFHFLTDPADRARYRDLLARAVAPGGRVAVATFAADGPEQCSGLPVRRYSADELVAELGAGFERRWSARVEHVTPWGAVQPFTWVVLERTAS